MKTHLAFIILLTVMISGCSTRQVITELNGSTAQRLVTHSIDRLMKQIPAEDFSMCENRKIYVESHFIKYSPLTEYATERFRMELAHRFGCDIVRTTATADYSVNLFFTSLGTDFDIFGLSIPFLVIPGYSGASDINILAIEMFHGISEMTYYLRDARGQVLRHRDKTKASVRTDKFALPFFTIPINTLD